MKKIAFLCIAAFVLFTQGVHAQKKFNEGTITYGIDVATDNEEAKQMIANSSLVLHLKGKNSKTEMSMGAFMKVSVFTMGDTKKYVMLMDVMGQKKQINMDEKDFKDYKKKSKAKSKVEYVDEKKTIAGYNCKKAIVTVNDSTKTTVWYTDELAVDPESNTMGGNVDQIKGFVMSYQTIQQGMTMNFTVSKVDAAPVSDDTFAVPTGYDQMTYQEFLKMNGQ